MFKLAATTVLGLLAMACPALAATCSPVPYPFSSGAVADATQVNNNFSSIVTCANTLLAPLASPSLTGNVGIGMTAGFPLDVNGVGRLSNNGGMGIELANIGTTTNRFLSYNRTTSAYGISTYDGSSHQFLTSGSEAGRFGTDGSFLVGTTSNGGWSGNVKAEVKSAGHTLSAYTTGTGGVNAVLARVDNTGANFAGFYYGSTLVGRIYYDGTVVQYANTSDERLKVIRPNQKDYRPIIERLWVGDFNWKKNHAPGFGILAQQAYGLFPFAVSPPKNKNDVWMADYGKFAPLALWGVKDLYKQEAKQGNRVSTLEQEIDHLHQVNADQAGKMHALEVRLSVLERSARVHMATN